MELRMKGKKTDPIFISQFIQESVREGIETPEQIVQRAKKMIEQIDEEIKSIDAKKLTRSKLLDVISSFEKKTVDRTQEAQLLPFFKLEYPKECKEICDAIVTYWMIEDNDDATPIHKFCFKQLVDQKVIDRVGKNRFHRGDRFDEYMTFVLQEAQ